MKKLIKSILFGNGEIQTIKGGIGKGLKMKIDVANKAQRVIGLDEREIQKPFADYAEKSDCFFDIGASDGYYSLLFRKHNKKADIYLFEAQERFKEEQVKHFELNNFPVNYHHFAKYVSNKNDDQNVSIDQLYKEKGKTLLFKIDVDGGEVDVLNGMIETIKNNNCLFVIETHSKQLEIDCIQFLEKLNYSTKIIDQGWYRSFLPEERPTAHNRWFTAIKKQ